MSRLATEQFFRVTCSALVEVTTMQEHHDWLWRSQIDGTRSVHIQIQAVLADHRRASVYRIRPETNKARNKKSYVVGFRIPADIQLRKQWQTESWTKGLGGVGRPIATRPLAARHTEYPTNEHKK